MIKLGIFNVGTKGHGYTLSVDKTITVKDKENEGAEIQKDITVDLGFYSKAEQVVNRIVQHELAKTCSKTTTDLNVFIAALSKLTNQIDNDLGSKKPEAEFNTKQEG